jgi:hypothetical protein
MDGRFSEIGEQVAYRLAELESNLRSHLAALEAREGVRAEGMATDAENRVTDLRAELTAAIEAERARADSDLRLFRSQMMEVQKQFAETLAHLVDEQIERTVTLRLQAIQDQMREAREESRTARESLAKDMETLLDARFEALHQQRSGYDRELAELRDRIGGQEQNTLDLLLALGNTCLRAAERSAPSTPSANGGGGGGENSIASEAFDVPGFARAKAPTGLWRVPFVSCFLVATSALLALHLVV